MSKLDELESRSVGESAVQIWTGHVPARIVRERVAELMGDRYDDVADQLNADPAYVRQMCEAFASGNPRFSFEKLRESIDAAAVAAGAKIYRGRETITSSQTSSAISNIVVHTIMSEFAKAPAIYTELAEVTTSNAESEVYLEEYQDDIPVLTGEIEPAPESRSGSREVRLRNYLYTRMLAISKKAFDTDKVGNVRDRATRFGQKAPLVMDRQWVFSVFRTFQYSQMSTSSPNGIVQPTNIAGGLAYAGALYPQAGIVGVPAGFSTAPSALSPASIENALLSPATFVDPYGDETSTGTEFDTLLCDSLDRFKAKRFVGSQINPVQLLANDTTGQSPGAFTSNVLFGEFTVAASPYVRRSRAPLSGSGYPWAMMKRKDNGAKMQILTPWNVEQEASNAGEAWASRIYRWQGKMEFAAGIVNGRKMYVGN